MGSKQAVTWRGRRPLPLASAAVRLVLAAGCLGAVLLWWLGTSSAVLRTPGTTATSAAELAGMIAGVLICVQILLLARVPWFERAVGQDQLVGWHRTLGGSVLGLTLTHVVLILAGGALQDRHSVWAEFWLVTLPQRDVLTALIGTTLLFVAGLTSARTARRHLSYEWWYWIHTGTYVAVFLTFGHQIHAGAHFVGRPVQQVIWAVLYLGTAAAVLTWRVLLPLLRIGRHRVRVHSVVRESQGMVSVWLSGHHLDELQVHAGQFFLFRFLARGHLSTAHPYSVSALPRQNMMRITVGALGDHSVAMSDLRPGTLVILEGPFGRFTSGRSRAGKVLLVAGGAGIGPIVALAHQLRDEGREVVVIHRAPALTDLALRQDMSGHPGLQVIPVLGRRRELGFDPISAHRLKDLVPDVADREIYLCGSTGLTAAVIHALRTLHVPVGHIHHEELSLS
ncbi:MAG: ferredoxin reductase family protein [Propionibacteriaceae bacterium]